MRGEVRVWGLLIAACQWGEAPRADPGWAARDTADTGAADLDGDGVPDAADGCPSDPAKVAPGWCGCGASEASCPWCGDGELDPGEACDDGNHLPLDGCLPGCRLDALALAPVIPAVAGVTNVLHAQGATPGALVWFLASPRRGQAAAPGCGTSTRLASPTVLGGVVADDGGHAFLAAWPPPGLAGREVGFVAAELDTCRVSPVRPEEL